MAEVFDPYHIWLGIAPEEQPPHYYRLLGVKPFENNTDALESAADQRMVHLRSFQTGKHAAESQKLLNELAAARLCLLSPDKRQTYDRELKAKLATVKPATGPSRPAVAKPLAVARALAAKPVARAAEPTTALGFDPLEQAPAKRPKKRSSNQSPAIYAGIGLGLIAVIAVAWIAIGGGGDDQPIAARDAKAPHAAADTARTGNENPPPTRTAPAPSKTEARPIAVQDVSAVPTGPLNTDVPPEDLAEPDEPADEMPLADSDADDQAGTDDSATDDRPAPRAADEIAAAVAEIQRVLHDDYVAAKKSAEKAVLAEKLIALVPDSSGAGEQYALLSEARRLAVAAGSPALALQAAEMLAESFAVDRFEQLAETADELAARDLSTAARKELVEAIEPLVEQALAAGQFAPGRRLAAVGLATARKTNQNDVAKTLARQGKELAAGEKLAASAADARAQLEQNPDDPKASETLGKYLCLYAGDWPAGLAHLAKAEDPALRSVAELETAADPTPSAQAKLGDAWWDMTEHAAADAARMRVRSGYWYGQAVEQLTGLSKVRVEKRLEELAASQPSHSSQLGPASQPSTTKGGVLADRLVVWNCHNNGRNNQGILSCNVELHKAGKVVWAKQAVPLAWKIAEDPPTTIPLPEIAFDTLRVEAVTYQGAGPALCEIEVFRGDTNLAAGKPVTSSGVYNADYPATAVVDGIKDSTHTAHGYWVSPLNQLAWIEVQVAPPAGSGRTRAEKPLAAVDRGATGRRGGVTADKLVLWNCHSNKWKDRGTLSANVELRKGGNVVWSKAAVPMDWSPDTEPATTIPLPKIAFDAVRVETVGYHGLGSALCEIEVFHGRNNLAFGKAVTTSGSHPTGRHPENTVVDGVKDSSKEYVGYWIGPDRQQSWVEVQIDTPANSGKPRPIPARSEPVAKKSSGSGSVTADKLVLWNCNSNKWKDRGMLSANIELRKADKVVWSKKDVPVVWSKDEEPATTIPLPKIAFDVLRVESATFHKSGTGLCEVEIFRGNDNLARGKPVTASGCFVGSAPPDAVVDGILNSSQWNVGYWVAPDRQNAWVEVQVAPPASAADKTLLGVTHAPPSGVGVVADKLVLWNCHWNEWTDRGMLSCNVELRRAGEVVWSQKSVPLEWRKDEEPATAIRLPKIPFDALRVETASYEGRGAALCEIEVYRGKKNLARERPVTASGVHRLSPPATAVVDGVRDSSSKTAGFWAAPDFQLSWIEVQLASPAAPSSAQTEKRPEPAVASKPTKAGDGVTADKLVLWNCNNNRINDRGMLSCNVELRKGGEIVWSKKAIPLAWSKEEEPATTVALPKVAFDALRVEAASSQATGPALCEVEIYRRRTNIARGKPATASGFYSPPDFPPAWVVDGITASTQHGVGYWVAPDHQQNAWVEVQVAPPATQSGKAVYLSDLPPSEVQLDPVHPLSHPAPVGGTTSPHSIFLHALHNGSSHAAFRLRKEYQKLSGAAAICDTAGDNLATPLTLRIVGDGKELWRATMQKPGPTKPVDVRVSRVDKLELFVDCPGNANWGHAVWVDLELTKP